MALCKIILNYIAILPNVSYSFICEESEESIAREAGSKYFSVYVSNLLLVTQVCLCADTCHVIKRLHYLVYLVLINKSAINHILFPAVTCLFVLCYRHIMPTSHIFSFHIAHFMYVMPEQIRNCRAVQKGQV